MECSRSSSSSSSSRSWSCSGTGFGTGFEPVFLESRFWVSGLVRKVSFKTGLTGLGPDGVWVPLCGKWKFNEKI